MRQLLTIFLAFCLVVGTTTAQTTILDFEGMGTSTTFQYFGNNALDNTLTSVVANPDMTGNTSANVCEFVKTAGAQTWAGAFSNPNPAQVTITNGGIITVDVYSTHLGTVKLKLEESTSGQPNYEVDVANTVTNAWETLSFDTGLPSSAAPNQVAAGDYAKIVLFFDFGVMGGATDETYYFDNITSTGVSATPNPVDFSVDLTNFINDGGVFTNVYVSGTLNGWSGDANQLTDPDGDSVYTATIPLIDGTYEFKFTMDNWAQQEQFMPGEPCTVTNGGFTNRQFMSAGPSTTLPVYCWNSCSDCSAPPPVPDTVYFEVDMNSYADTAMFTTVYVSGTMNNWSGDANPLSDADGDNVWTGEMTLFPGTYEFKYQVDAWSDQENFMGGESCTVTNGGFTNREFTMVMGMNNDLGGVDCFQSCDACVPDVCEELDNVKAYVTSSTSVMIGWDLDPTATYSQQVWYRVAGTTAWTKQNVGPYPRNAYWFRTLTPNTTYQYRARRVCGVGDNGIWSPIQTFTTYTTDPCSGPTENFVRYHTIWGGTRVQLASNYEPDADNGNVQVRWKELTATTWNQRNSFNNAFANAKNLTPDTDYEVQWRARCSNAWTPWAATDTFTTLPAAGPLAPPAQAALRNDVDFTSTISIAPNPVSASLRIEGVNQAATIQVFSIYGQKVRDINVAAGTQFMDVQDLHKGTYVLRVLLENGETAQKKFVKI